MLVEDLLASIPDSSDAPMLGPFDSTNSLQFIYFFDSETAFAIDCDCRYSSLV
jgi:hypothetical protein